MDEYFAYEVEGLGLVFQYPEWWYLRIQDDGSLLLIDEFVGQLQLRFYKGQALDWKQVTLREAESQPQGGVIIVAGVQWATYQIGSDTESGTVVQHHFVSGLGKVRIEATFSHRAEMLLDDFQAQGVEAMLEEAKILLGSIETV